MLSYDFDQDFEQLAREAWERHKSPLERMYDSWVGNAWEPTPPSVTFRIYHRTTGLPIPCHICDSTDNWVVEGDEVRQLARIFVCEHEPVWVGRGMIRQIASIPVGDVGEIEETGRPLE